MLHRVGLIQFCRAYIEASKWELIIIRSAAEFVPLHNYSYPLEGAKSVVLKVDRYVPVGKSF